MSLTAFHATYYAHELTKRSASSSIEKLTAAVAGARVDLNPHQVEAALFAFNSPLSRGALLADEVGLGKTIEAGLVISQHWAERRQHLLVITPANLRKQWHQELSEKFFLPCTILESRSYNDAVKQGKRRPFNDREHVVICSYQFARARARDIQAVPWDLVVIDEAHRLRNVYKPSNIIANTLKEALAHRNKLLLTATPLQNSLLELYGLVSFIDERAFGDLRSFREQFAGTNRREAFQALKDRLRPLCHRTLRRQVTAYIPYTARHSILEEFTPQESEDYLYELVSEYLRRDNLQALPASQRSLITLVLRKLLASSTFAIAGALTSMSKRLKEKLARGSIVETVADDLDREYEALAETAEEWEHDGDGQEISTADREAIKAEIGDLDAFVELATSIGQNSKGTALLKALDIAFRRASEMGASHKAIIFTESRRTQDYLLRLLADSAYADGIVLFNGTNTDPGSREIYARWLARHQGSERVTGSRTADMRSALVDYFREEGRIMIATEAGAEGINLQFCSLVVNYDLPWNPQRIEQRIGRCHRYGQKHDVVVVNFVNRKNEADRRVYDLLSEKFALFEGVFGASDEVLGALESGVDFEKRIADIYQRCRQPAEIKAAFDQLQQELSIEINDAMTRTRQQLLEHFDDEVRDKLRVRDQESRQYLGRFQRWLLELTQYEVNGAARAVGEGAFLLNSHPFPEANGSIPLGLYELPQRSGDAHAYRLEHPLAQTVVNRAKTRTLEPAEVEFDLTGYEGRVSILTPLVGIAGWLNFSRFTVDALDQSEDHLLLIGVTDDGQPLDDEQALRLMTLPGRVGAPAATPDRLRDALDHLTSSKQATIKADIAERNGRFFEAEAEKLDSWADDLKAGLERDIKELDRQIREARRAATAALTLDEKLAGQKQIRALEAQRNQKRRSLFDAQDDVDRQRDAFIQEIEGKLAQKQRLQPVFTLRWRIV